MTEYTEPPTRNYHREIVEERDHLRTQLQNVITAWEALPGGYYSPGRIERWLVDDMKPAIDAARAAFLSMEDISRASKPTITEAPIAEATIAKAPIAEATITKATIAEATIAKATIAEATIAKVHFLANDRECKKLKDALDRAVTQTMCLSLYDIWVAHNKDVPHGSRVLAKQMCEDRKNQLSQRVDREK